MNLVELKKELITQRKARNKIAIPVLSLLVGTVETENKNGNSVDIYSKIRKLIEVNEEVLELRPDVKLSQENEYLQNLLPKELTEQEIIAILGTLELTKNDIGKAMSHFKQNHTGQYNGGELSKIVRNYLK